MELGTREVPTRTLERSIRPLSSHVQVADTQSLTFRQPAPVTDTSRRDTSPARHRPFAARADDFFARRFVANRRAKSRLSAPSAAEVSTGA